ncbi:tyrosine-type recombinase/integrase [Marinobacter xestospongiae]|uniref:Tyrosine-type recombinase/integrase n=1 Tax=Marinobacter xestospongiae TaxID=994319 RepID=A0ABU3W1I9_9GAMM|nr:tyrosine-type recombinase/integrase [Marinobacter xestospongiae]MDV2080385.1 tyrosine-type recombinase/integrase [Marinobacter xestospongiae]
MKKFSSFEYCGITLSPLWVIFNNQWKPPLSPLLFTTFLARFNTVFELRCFSHNNRKGETTLELVEKEVGEKTIRSYVFNLAQFLSYLEECHLEHNTPDMHSSTSCSERFVNHYLNKVLASRLLAPGSLDAHRSALTAYFNFCHYMEFGPRMMLSLDRKTRQEVANNSEKPNYIKYVTRNYRRNLLIHCHTLAEKLMMRLGFAVGLRTSELTGLTTKGLAPLFTQLEASEFTHVEQFKYWLKGCYTKGGRSRWIYFDRELLSDMQRYYKTERQWVIDQTKSTEDTFFLRTDNGGLGKRISAEQGTNVFKKRASSAGLNPQLSFHDLRHTFATELFHEEITGPDGRETRSESAALIVVAQRLGHAFTKSGHAPPVTTRYIRMRVQMLELEGEL